MPTVAVLPSPPLRIEDGCLRLVTPAHSLSEPAGSSTYRMRFTGNIRLQISCSQDVIAGLRAVHSKGQHWQRLDRRAGSCRSPCVFALRTGAGGFTDIAHAERVARGSAGDAQVDITFASLLFRRQQG